LSLVVAAAGAVLVAELMYPTVPGRPTVAKFGNPACGCRTSIHGL
jgi:hypothetical protein